MPWQVRIAYQPDVAPNQQSEDVRNLQAQLSGGDKYKGIGALCAADVRRLRLQVA